MNQGIEFSFERTVAPEALRNLMLQTGWGQARTIQGLEQLLASSSATLSAWDQDHLVGFARVLTDWVYRAVIEDVVVDEPVRGRGIGSRIVQLLMDRLAGVERIYLFTGDVNLAYYARFGFERPPYFALRYLRPEGDEPV